MIKFWILFILLSANFSAQCQKKIVAGDVSCEVDLQIHDIRYELSFFKDSITLKFLDSSVVFVGKDSQVVQNIYYQKDKGSEVQTLQIYNRYKQIVCKKFMIGSFLKQQIDYVYEDKKGKLLKESSEDFVKREKTIATYQYSYDKINGDLIAFVTHSNGSVVEYYTKEFFDKKNRKYKEMRIASDKKTNVHTESFFYDDFGKLINRSIYFNEFNVTKNYPEVNIGDGKSCFKTVILPQGGLMKELKAIELVKHVLKVNLGLFSNKECLDFEYRFVCPAFKIVVKTNKERMKIVTLSSFKTN
jgi:hypothetical protein